jgi:dihydroorotate dehydrogenase
MAVLPASAEIAYRILYHGLIERLPEARAVAVGQALLRRLPVHRLPGFRLDDPRLRIMLGGVTLPNPVILSSMYYDPAILRAAMALGFGAVTTKSITVGPRPGHPEPNLVRVRSEEGRGFINCNGFKNPGLDAYRRMLQGLPHRVPLIVAVAGESVEEYVALVEGLGPLGDLVELNISSPNTRLVYELSSKPDVVRRLFKAVRAATAKPLIVKLSPDFEANNYTALVPAALEEGITILNYGNTRRVSATNLSQGAGGLSGPALFPNTLANVRRLRKEFGEAFEIIATGGIDSPAKAVQLLESGATAVSYFTAFITRGPTLPRRIGEAILAALAARGGRAVTDLRG